MKTGGWLSRVLLPALAVVAVVFVMAAVSRTVRIRQAERSDEASQKPVPLSAGAGYIIGPHPDFQGDAASPYTLVEFTDFQCPACRQNYLRLADVMARHRGRIRLVVRNYPLSIHMNARRAAIAAEAAREQGRFWPFYDALFQSDDLSAGTIDGIAKKQGVDLGHFARSSATTAPLTVQNDLNAAEKLDLPGTPTFILCYPDGHALRLRGLSQLDGLIG